MMFGCPSQLTREKLSMVAIKIIGGFFIRIQAFWFTYRKFDATQY